MKRWLILALSAILFYSFIRDLNAIRVFILLVCLASALVLSRVPERYIAGAKHPLIVLCLLASIFSVMYGSLVIRYQLQLPFMILSFYALALCLPTLGDQRKEPIKEIIAVSVIMCSVAVNLYVAGRPLMFIPVSIAVGLTLYMTGKMKALPFVGGYLLLYILFLVSMKQQIFENMIAISDMGRYLILGSMFLFFLITYVALVKTTSPLKNILFFGFLALSLDILMVMGMKMATGLLAQPITAVILLTPLVGMLLKITEGGAS